MHYNVPAKLNLIMHATNDTQLRILAKRVGGVSKGVGIYV
jgi:hypothetical protein